ncbi:MAG: FliO/MopB family protein [Planctomycetaceae bacterium]|nr:FliO/MopB family protein [Planctomycetales bacterium]MCB9924793.1 FliO/MopB family protein [Planctomycetaceae bacterium]
MSNIVRSMLALALLGSTAHAQSSQPYADRADADQTRILQLPPARASSFQTEQATSSHQTAIRTASHAESAETIDSYTPLPLRTSSTPQRLSPESSNRSSGRGATTTVIGSLTVVLAAFLVLAWLSKKTAPKGMAPLPGEVFEPLGRAPLNGRQQMQLIRLGNKLVLINVTSTGAETLTEITDIDEVNRLSALCQQGRSGSISDTFRQVLSQYADEPAPGGFVGDPSLSQVDIANRAKRRDRRREDHRE